MSIKNIESRNSVLDILKGLGIICIVMGHSGAPFTNFLYLFHVSIFIISSGFCYKSEYSDTTDNLKILLKKKIISLYIPYVLFGTCFSILHNFFININVYTSNPLIETMNIGKYCDATSYFSIKDVLIRIIRYFFLVGDSQLFGASWFLTVLLIVVLLYYVLDFCYKKIVKCPLLLQTITSFVFLFVGFALKKNSSQVYSVYVGRIFSCYCLMNIGVCLKFGKELVFRAKSIVQHLVILLGAFLVLWLCTIGSIDLGSNKYNDPLFLIIVSSTGWIFLYELASLINETKTIKKVVAIIGKNTLSVLVLHFLCFKFVNYIGVLILNKPRYLVAAFPVLFTGDIMWLLYTICGVFIPVFCSVVWKSFVQNFLKFLTKKEIV